MPLLDVLIGKPLPSVDERGEKINSVSGVSIFGLDALSSAAYGPEAALTLLLPLGLMGVHYIVPIIGAILVLLLIVFASYRQTIDAYPNGGGSYTVASENLGPHAGLLAAAALMIDYVLTASVGISAGVGALISAAPGLQPHTLAICLGILLLLTLVNLRGVRDTGIIILTPTYLFLACLLTMIALGAWHAIATGGHPHAIVAPPHVPAPHGTYTGWVLVWLMLRVFSSGCTAMTGVEAVSNGIGAFSEPRQKNAKTTLTIIILALVVLLAGIAWLCRAYGIGATDPNSPHYESVLSELLKAVSGQGWFYYVSIGSILAVLALSANTAFADFPRLTRAIASNSYLPRMFTLRGRRLLYSWGVYVLVALTGTLLIIFRGVTDRLIPLYAIGAFLAFTLSQTGMVVHWYRKGGSRLKMLVNGVGALATGLTTIVVLVTKFVEGAWITALLIPVMIALMLAVHRHYTRVSNEIASDKPLSLEHIEKPYVILPIDRWSRVSEKALRYALSMSDNIEAMHVRVEGSEEHSITICEEWEHMVFAPMREAGLTPPRLTTLDSPYRFVLMPMVEHVLLREKELGDRNIAVVVPELVVMHWWENLLHNQRSNVLKLLLLVRGNRNIFVVNIPWYL